MSGPVERQGLHIPEPECPPVVMADPACTHSALNRPAAVRMVYPSRQMMNSPTSRPQREYVQSGQ